VVSSPAPVAASARRLPAREGCGVVAVARSGELLQLAAAAGHDSNRRIVPCVADRREPDGVARAVAAAKQAFGRLDILVNTAGTIKRGDVFARSRRR
jgi:NADP-dependent 3-hydroxy acid dehydrogenase YdfG